MNTNVLADRGKGLEDAFFANQDALLRRRLADLAASQSKTEALAEASGITDPVVIEHLMRLGLSAATITAITLVPLVAVAWADGSLDEPERAMLLFNAAHLGVDGTHPAYGLFEAWLKAKPEPALLDAWKLYVAALPQDTRAALKPVISDRTHAVADAAGGFLGLGRRISGVERALLDDIDQALSA